MEDYALGQVLDAIQRREASISKRTGATDVLGMEMVQAAREFIRLPCVGSLLAFQALEDRWRSHHPTARRRFANIFQASLGIQSAPRTTYAGNTPFNKNWNPARGFVYGFWAHERFGLVKLGATTQHPSDRREHFLRKYNIAHLKIAFFFEVSMPADVERHWTNSLRTYRCHLGPGESREWYALAPNEAKCKVLEAIESSGVRRYPLAYVMKNLDAWKEIDFWPNGPKRFGAHIVPREG